MAHDGSYVIVANSRDHQHNHQQLVQVTLHTPKLDFLYDNDFQQDDQNTVHHADVIHAFTPKKAVLVNFQEPGTNMPTTSNASGANTPKKSSAELKLNAPSFAATAAKNVRF